jgi:DNA-binding LytR/AlgR family response regulator
VSFDRLKKTVVRLKQRLRTEPSVLVSDLLETLGRSNTAPLQWIRAGFRDEVKLIAVEDVLCFIASDKYTRVVTCEKEHLIRKSIKELEVVLDPNRFWRIHRGTIVNLAFVDRCHRDDAGRLQVSVSGLRDSLNVSKSYTYRFKQM